MTTIRTIRWDAISDDISTVSLDEVEPARPAPGEVQLALKACSVNFC